MIIGIGGLAGRGALRCTVANVSEEKRTQPAPRWTLPKREGSEDKTWDQLGDEWRAVDGVVEGHRIYVKWTYIEDGSSHLSGLHIADVPITSDLLRAIQVGRLENAGRNLADLAAEKLYSAIATGLPASEGGGLAPPLRREKGEDPEVFADRVAQYYRVFSGISSKPAKMISVASDVPLATVHGWIREARLRGKLPPGKRGKAG
jgi:hypothetical protein